MNRCRFQEWPVACSMRILGISACAKVIHAVVIHHKKNK